MSTKSASFHPVLLYRDADAAMGWLEDALGFRRLGDHRDEEGNVAHAELALGEAVVMLSSAGKGREPFSGVPAGGSVVYCATEEVEALHNRAREAGADIALELTDTDYGSRDFTVRDPEGNLWAFGTYRPRAGG